MNALAIAIVLGGALGLGLVLIASAAPRWRAPSAVQRIAPYVRDVTDAAGTTPGVLPDLPGALGRALGRAGERIGDALGSRDAVERRLAQAGSTLGVQRYRGIQLALALAAAAVGAVLAVGLALAGRPAPAAVLLAPIGAVLGAMSCDLVLQRRARARAARVREELPEVLAFLGMCLAAGEGLTGALTRVGSIGSGDLTAQLRAVVLAAGTGAPLADELQALGRRLDVPELSRAIDQLVASIERGAPLAQVLQAQAADAREASRRTLIEHAGRAEIVMLVPLVFLILPLSVLFAIYPGIHMLGNGIG